MNPSTEAQYMARALRLAERGLNTTHPNPRVGCVLVKDGQRVGEGWHARAGGPHAEIEALRVAGDSARGATAYVSLEPCSHYGRTPPCAEGLIAAGVSRVVAAMQDPNPLVAGRGLKMLEQAGIETAVGLLEAEAEALNLGYCKRMRTGRPFLFSKLAMSLDGRTAMASGESQWISGAEARRDVHRLRARSSAILTGIETVLADDPALTVRLPSLLPEFEIERQPARIVLDSRFRLPASAKILQQPGRTLVIGLEDHEARAEALRSAGAEVHYLAADGQGRVDLNAVLDLLGRLEFNEIMVEAGSILNGALLQTGLVDEWMIYLAPCILGDEGRGLFRLPGLSRMSDRFDLSLIESRQVGRDLRLRFKPEQARSGDC
ncbi:MAG: bifunctional diaminohydroxyphosphoribosylaminopyrimidine deaminase/5-amino-6-(5-phosphoribosylamino)uracil reductase RibD [Methylococcaceae bacterium]|nr:bifunctional diaminohydroxyphosphoribosylaminopyrimidine deaminase/5-amino-6-(5-phosphoribosylamino)uracil reductase RibD [Methylococcaceae bacterium]